MNKKERGQARALVTDTQIWKDVEHKTQDSVDFLAPHNQGKAKIRVHSYAISG